MGRLEMTCRGFRFGGGGDDETRGHESSLCESAAAEIVHGLLPPGQDVGLKRGEDWKVLCHLAHGLIARGEDPAQVGALLRLGRRFQPKHSTCKAYRETATDMVVASGLPPRRCLARIQDTAEVYASHGQWEAGSELLLTGLQFLNVGEEEAIEEGRQAIEARTVFLTQLCFFLIDKIYSGTYVNRDEAKECVVAFNSGKQGIAMARKLLALDNLKAGVGSEEQEPEQDWEKEVPQEGLPLCQALIAAGRAYGITGQHLALGAMPDEYASCIPSAEEIFDDAIKVLSEVAEITLTLTLTLTLIGGGGDGEKGW